MLAMLVEERERASRRLVTLPPEGATLHEIERAALLTALERCGWVQAEAARLLGTTPRVMSYKMARFHLYAERPRDIPPRLVPRNPRGNTGVRRPREAGKDWRLAAANIH